MFDKTAHQKTESKADDLKALLQEAEQALNNVVGKGGEKFDELRARIHSAVENSGRHSLEHLREEASRRAKMADQFVHDNPYYAVGVAAGVGALIGILASRSCNSSR